MGNFLKSVSKVTYTIEINDKVLADTKLKDFMVVQGRLEEAFKNCSMSLTHIKKEESNATTTTTI